MAKKKAAQASIGPRVYSYIRFSTPEQALGDSERRQLDLAKAYADKRGMHLDESLRLADKGVSGFHGTNRKSGNFGQFLARIEAGKVFPGSILLVENTDRLTREDPLTAITVVAKIIQAGITIVTLSPYTEYSTESVAGGLIYQLTGQIQMAHAESKKKSERLSAARESARRAAREDGRLLTRMLPNWLRVNDKQEIVKIPEAVRVIQLIFKLRLKGISVHAIESRLNREAVWSPPPKRKADRGSGMPGNGWRASYIKKILRNPAVFGEHQPFRTVG